MTGNGKGASAIEAIAAIEAADRQEADKQAAELGFQPLSDPDAGAPTGPMARPVIKSQDVLAREALEKDQIALIAVNGIMDAMARVTGGHRMTTAILQLINQSQSVVSQHYDARQVIDQAKGAQ